MPTPWTDPITWTALNKLRAAELNTNLRDNTKYLKEQTDALAGGSRVRTQAFGSILDHTMSPGTTYEVGLLPTALEIPWSGVVLTQFVLQCRQVTASYTRIEVSADSGGLTIDGAPGAAWVWDVESAFHPLRNTISGWFLAVVSPGSWTPSVSVLNHGDSTDSTYLNQIAGLHILTDNYGGLIP
jgi:hypothetical protein